MKIDHKLVEKLAQLSRLNLTPEEMSAFEKQLPPIVDYVGQLQSVELEEVPPTVAAPTTMRTDSVATRGEPKDILDRAPKTQDGFWKVDSVRS